MNYLQLASCVLYVKSELAFRLYPSRKFDKVDRIIFNPAFPCALVPRWHHTFSKGFCLYREYHVNYITPCVATVAKGTGRHLLILSLRVAREGASGLPISHVL